jgi:hypothetical protein
VLMYVIEGSKHDEIYVFLKKVSRMS